MRIFLVALFLLSSFYANAQDVLKMVDGTDKYVKMIGLLDGKVAYYELGDPLSIEKSMPRNRVSKIIYEDGKVENLREFEEQAGIVMVKKTAPDTLREAVILKTSEEIKAKIIAVEPTEIIIRRRTGPKMGYQERIKRDLIARLRYPDGTEQDIAQEARESAGSYGRQVFSFYDETGPDLYFRYHFVTKAAGSQGRLYTPDEIMAFKRYVNLRDAVEHRTDVRFLDLTGQKLTSLPHDVVTLKRLVALDISNNPLGQFPAEVLSLPNLQYLWVDSCQLAELKPEVDNKKASNLIYLSARGNKLKEFNPAVGNLPSLYVLRLDNNNIKRVKGKGLFSATPGVNSTLSIVSLAGNGLEELPAGLGAFPQMRYVGCRSNALTEAEIEGQGFARLAFLDLGQNPLKKLSPSLLKLPALESLHVDNTYVSRLPESGWAQAKNLHWVSLPNTASPLPEELWKAPALYRLDIAGKQDATAKAITIPAHVPDSLAEADFSGLTGGHRLALAIKASKPKIKVVYYHPLMGKVQESGLEGPTDLNLYSKVAAGDTAAARQMGNSLARVGDYGLALTALAAGSPADTNTSETLRTEQARIFSLPQVQDLMASRLAIRSYTSVVDAQKNLVTSAAYTAWLGLCHTATGPAPHPACQQAAALLKTAAEGINKLATDGNAKLADSAREYAAQLRAQAEALDKQ